MSQETKIKELFARSPTRELEEVQKVNAKKKAENDVDEFYETDSARKVLEELGEIVKIKERGPPRFLYIYATFGSGKTHLLKLIGFATGQEEGLEYLADDLSSQFTGFNTFRRAINESHVDNLVPVFLNLLDRNPSDEPPIPLLIYKEFGRKRGYPVDPLWLLEWCWKLDVKHNIWDELKQAEHDGKTLDDVIEERATIRSWLCSVVPSLEGAEDTPYNLKASVREGIKNAVQEVEEDEFSAEKLTEKLDETTGYLEEKHGETYEYLIGLDEVALFVGDNRTRYREFVETMEEFHRRSNFPVIGTGQWSLKDIEEDLMGEVENDWVENEVKLKETDTEIIVRKRWLRKDPEGEDKVEKVLSKSIDWELTLADDEDFGSDFDAVESYPFREYDLWLLRRVMQGLITGTGTQPAKHEYIRGRALLVLVRALFTNYDWGEKEIGRVVTWDQVFDLLAEETPYVPSWIQDRLVDLETTFGGGNPFELRVAKVLYLLNQTESVPATLSNTANLLVSEVDEDHDSVERSVSNAIEALSEKEYIHEEDSSAGTVYRLLSEEEFDVAEKINQHIPPEHQKRGHIEEILKEDNLLTSEDTRTEPDVGSERKVPIVVRYSILEEIPTNPTPQYDSVVIRVVADRSETVDEKVEKWHENNSSGEGSEDILVAVKIPEGRENLMTRVISMNEVLNGSSFSELQRRRREQKKRLEQEIGEQLEMGEVYVGRTQNPRGNYGSIIDDVIEDEVQRKFPNRKVLSKPLRETDDARDMSRFFEGNRSSWPLGDEDAQMLGVDTMQIEIDDGWVEEFMEKWGDEKIIRGDDLVNEIEGMSGEYLGTPLESLAALILCLATSKRITIKRDGEPLSDPEEMGRSVRTKSDFSDIQIRTDAVDPEEISELKDVYKNLRGFRPSNSNNDPEAMLSDLEKWVGEESKLIKTVSKRVSREFSGEVSIEDLEEALEPAMKGGELSEDELLRSPVPEQAEKFSKAKDVLAGDDPLWDEFKEEADVIDSVYYGSEVATRVQGVLSGDEVPDKDKLEELIDEAKKHRRGELQSVYRGISGGSTSTEDPNEICSETVEWVENNVESIRDLLDEVEDEFGVSLDDLESLVESVSEGKDVGEEDLIGVRGDAKKLDEARQVLEDGWDELKDKLEELRDSHPDSSTTNKIEKLVSSSGIPSSEEVSELLEEAEDPKTEEEEDEEEGEEEVDEVEQRFKRVWSEVSSLEEGSIVLIDSKEEQ